MGLILILCLLSALTLGSNHDLSLVIFIVLGIVFLAPLAILLFTRGSTRSAKIEQSFLEAHRLRMEKRSKRSDGAKSISSDVLAGFYRPVHSLHSVHDCSLYEALVNFDHWLIHLIWWGLAAGEVNFQQLAQINSAAGGTHEELAATVIVSGVSRCVGQITIGHLSDRASKWGVTRPLLACFMIMGVVISHVILAAGGGVLPSSVFAGFCAGALWSLLAPIVLEVTGPSKFATIFTFTYLSYLIALLFYQQGIVAPIYENTLRMQRLQTSHSSTSTCCGIACFQLAHVILCICAALLAFGVFVLHLRTKQYYFTMERERQRYDNQQHLPLKMIENRISRTSDLNRELSAIELDLILQESKRDEDSAEDVDSGQAAAAK